jgi:predicted permease
MPRWFSRHRTHEDFSAEIQAHLDLEADRLEAEGLSPQAARDAAHRAFGNVTHAKERFYETSRWTWLEQLLQDLRYAARSLRQSPSFLATTVLTLAVGIGLLTIAFTAFNAYVLRPFAIRDPHGLYQIIWHTREDAGPGFRWRDYEEVRQRTDLFDAVIGEQIRVVSSNGRPQMAALVSSNYFDALGPAIALGRGLTSHDADDAVVLGHEAWRRLFNGDAGAIGKAVDINGRPHVIVGVLTPAFSGLDESPRDFFLPRTVFASRETSETREAEITVRLRAGLTPIQVEGALSPFLTRVIRDLQDQRDPRNAVRAEIRPQSGPNPLTLEMLAVVSPVFFTFALVLIASCANVSNVMLARAIARHRDIAVRLSIGASRGRVVRQMLTEGLLIALLAGLASLGIASAGLQAARAALVSTLPASVTSVARLAPMPLDYRVFAFTLAISAIATVLFALLPALQASKVSLVEALRAHGGAAKRGSRLRSALVAGQVAVALVLVITAITLVNNNTAIGALDLGFAPEGVLSINVRGTQDDLVRPLAQALAADPRVGEIAVTSGNPLFNSARLLVATPPERRTPARTRVSFVSPEFFPMLHIQIARGRAFDVNDARTAARIAIVSESIAKTLWPGENPVGKSIRLEPTPGRSSDELPDYPEVTVIGTVRDIVSGILIAGPDSGHIYLPMSRQDRHATAILIRGRGDRPPDAFALQDVFRHVASDPQVFETIPLSDMRDLQMYPLLAASWIGILLGAVALALSVSGLYGVLTYALSQRRKEIGIRMALGATARAVMGLVFAQSMRLALIGAAIGTIIAIALLMALKAAIPLKTITLLAFGPFFAGLVLILAATALAASQPARQATRVNPSSMLRSDG